MRFRSFQLTAYGKFVTQSVAFPGAPSLLVVCGPNEAGKSTLRHAITDFFYGVPLQSTQAHQFPRADMVLSAEVQFEGAWQSITRKTKRRDSLLRADGSAVDEVRWQSALGGLDRAGFMRMFALGRDELVEGAEQMLSSGAEAGRLVFEAAAGLTTFTGLSATLSEEAAAAYSLRGTSTQHALAKKRLDAASVALKGHEHREPAYRALQKRAAETQEALDALIERRRSLRAQLESRRRILRALPQLRQIHQLEGALVGDAPTIVSPSAQAEVDRLCGERQQIDSDHRRVSKALDEARSQGAALVVRDDVLATEGLDDLLQQRSNIEQFETDIKSRVAQREQLRPEIDHELGWLGLSGLPIKELHTLLPSIDKVDAVKQAADSVLSKAGTVRDLCIQRQQLVESHQDASEKLVGVTLNDLDSLRDAVFALEAAADHVALRTSRDQLASDAIAVSQRFGDLGLGAGSNLLRTELPTEQYSRDADADLRQNTELLASLGRSLTENKQARASAEARLAQLALKDLPTLEDLHSFRQHRDEAFESVLVARDPDAVAAYRTLVRDADSLSDRRFESASAAQEMDRVKTELAAIEARLDQIMSDDRAVGDAVKNAANLWVERCSRAGMPEVAVEEYPTWRQRLREADALATTQQTRWLAHQAALSDVMPKVAAIWKSLGVPGSPGRDEDPVTSIDAALREGRRVQAEREKQANVEATLRQQVAIVQRRLDDITTKVSEAAAAAQDALRHLSEALSAAGLSPNLSAEAALECDRRIEVLRGKARDFNNLDDGRIRPMRDRVQTFKDRVSELATLLAVSDGGAWAITLDRLATLFKDQQDLAQRRKAIRERIDELERELKSTNDERQANADALSSRLTSWGVAEVEGFRELLRTRSTWDQTTEALQQRRKLLSDAEGGRSVEDLRAESEGVDEDNLMAEVALLDEESDSIETPYQLAVEAASEAKRALEEVTGSEAAALAKNEYDSATLALNRALDTYLHCVAEQQLLDWAIARFREDQQSPLLAAAENYLRTLTNERYTRVLVDESKPGIAQLVAFDKEGKTTKTIDALSAGTRDQLYLALRLAGLERHLEEGRSALPFIADDLFVNFDDARAEAGFRALASLATRTQVIYFTHHPHLVDLARKALGEAVAVASLGNLYAA